MAEFTSRLAVSADIPALMVLIVFFQTAGGLGSYVPSQSDPYAAFMLVVAAAIGFFATAGAAGVDIAMNGRDKRDVSMGGIVGIVIAIIFTAGISVIVVAGAKASGVVDPSVATMTDCLKQKLSPGVIETSLAPAGICAV